MRSVQLTLLVVALLASSTALAQNLKFEKYTLPNGLTVILHEDHSLPLAGVNLWYYVGSKDEKPGRSGFAHLFEHLMFMGTDRVPGGEFDKIMEKAGGWNNASTSEDRTNYYEVGPPELLPTLLWLEADRLEALGRTMTQEKLDRQRDVVRNERRQSYENRPYGKAELLIYELMFPPGHPYHIPVIGTHEDLEAATVDDVKNFFATYYVAANASLVVAGDFDTKTVKPLIEKLFGSLPRGNDVSHAKAEPVSLPRVVRVTATDAVQFPKTYIVYHSPAKFAPGDAELTLASAVLASGISSRLYQKLIYQNELATEVSAAQWPMKLGSLFAIEATAKPGVSLDDVEKAIDEVIGEFVKAGPTLDELERQKTQVEYGMLQEAESLLSRADLFNSYEFYHDDPDGFSRDLDRYRKADVKAVQQVAARTFTPDRRLILRVIPEIETPELNPRDQRPTTADTRGFSPLEPQTVRLANGITIHHWRRSDLPLVAMMMVRPVGSTTDPADKTGLAALTAEMLDEGAGDRDAIQFANSLDALGATFSAGIDQETMEIGLTTLARNFGPALDLFADAVLRPKFAEKEWDRVHTLHVEELQQSLDEPAYVAGTVAMRAFFGDAHTYSRPVNGTLATAKNISLADVKQAYAKLVRPEDAVVLIAGDLTLEEAKSQIERAFGSWKPDASAKSPQAPKFEKPANTALRVILVDRPDAVQTVIRFVMPGRPYADAKRIPYQLISTILGGTFTSRLVQNLREEKGYTYGVRSAFTFNPSLGYLTASSSVRADVTGASVKEFLKEFHRIAGGDISSDEAAKARSTMRMNVVQAFEGVGGIVDTGATLVRNGRPFSALAQDLDAIGKTTEVELNREVYEAITLNQAVLILVGDMKAVVPQLEGIELPKWEEWTVTGEPKNSNK